MIEEVVECIIDLVEVVIDASTDDEKKEVMGKLERLKDELRKKEHEIYLEKIRLAKEDSQAYIEGLQKLAEGLVGKCFIRNAQGGSAQIIKFKRVTTSSYGGMRSRSWVVMKLERWFTIETRTHEGNCQFKIELPLAQDAKYISAPSYLTEIGKHSGKSDDAIRFSYDFNLHFKNFMSYLTPVSNEYYNDAKNIWESHQRKVDGFFVKHNVKIRR